MSCLLCCLSCYVFAWSSTLCHRAVRILQISEAKLFFLDHSLQCMHAKNLGAQWETALWALMVAQEQNLLPTVGDSGGCSPCSDTDTVSRSAFLPEPMLALGNHVQLCDPGLCTSPQLASCTFTSRPVDRSGAFPSA